MSRAIPCVAEIFHSSKATFESLAKSALKVTREQINALEIPRPWLLFSLCLMVFMLMSLGIYLICKAMRGASRTVPLTDRYNTFENENDSPPPCPSPPPPSQRSNNSSQQSSVGTDWTAEESDPDHGSADQTDEDPEDHGFSDDDDDDDDNDDEDDIYRRFPILPSQLRPRPLPRHVRFAPPQSNWRPPRSPTPYAPDNAPVTKVVSAKRIILTNLTGGINLTERPKNAPEWFVHSKYSIWPAGSWREKRIPVQS